MSSVQTTDKKWGGLEGFQQITSKRRLVQAKRKATKEAKYAASDEGKAEQARIAAEREAAEALSAAAPAREHALQVSMAKYGLQHERGFRPYKDYLRRGIGDPDQIALQAAHLKWLFANTDIRARMEQEWETEGASPLDPIWHGIGWGGGDEQQYHDHEPLSLDRMSSASARARQRAMEQWYNQHRASPADLQGVPAGLLHLVVR